MSKIVRVKADNVAAVFGRRPFVLEETFASLAPPWPLVALEYPSISGAERRLVLVRADADVDAVLPAMGFRDDDPAPNVVQAVCEGAALDAREGGYAGPFGWVILLLIYAGRPPTHGFVTLGWLGLALDERGRVQGNRWALEPKYADAGGTEESLIAAAGPALWTIALSHVRNARWEEHRRVTTRAVRRRRAAQGHKGADVYRTLRLELPRRRGGGGGDALAPGTRAHVVAGHFAHYGDCCPGAHPPNGKLFGRLEGVYFVPGHVRGDAELGTVDGPIEPTVTAADL